MAYSTGSGTYIDLMAAVLAHAIADGWTTQGGDWPINKGNVRGVDWDTFTSSDTDWTSGAGTPHTTRWIRVAVGSSPANATANLGANAAHFPNMEYNIDQWYIFSDPASGTDFINVVVEFTNGTDPKVYGHFSFGEVDKHGMGYGGIAYASGHPIRGFSSSNANEANNGNDSHNGIYARCRRHLTGQLGYSYTFFNVQNNLCYMVDPTNSPFPALPTWPDPDVLYNHDRLMDTYGPSSHSFEPQSTDWRGMNNKMNSAVMYSTAQAYSGGISLGPIPLLIANGTTNSSTLTFMSLGSFPQTRVCSLQNFLPGDEVTFGADTWKIFPLLCQKARSTLGQQFQVTSGQHGFAYKKVV